MAETQEAIDTSYPGNQQAEIIAIIVVSILILILLTVQIILFIHCRWPRAWTTWWLCTVFVKGKKDPDVTKDDRRSGKRWRRLSQGSRRSDEEKLITQECRSEASETPELEHVNEFKPRPLVQLPVPGEDDEDGKKKKKKKGEDGESEDKEEQQKAEAPEVDPNVRQLELLLDPEPVDDEDKKSKKRQDVKPTRKDGLDPDRQEQEKEGLQGRENDAHLDTVITATPADDNDDEKAKTRKGGKPTGPDGQEPERQDHDDDGELTGQLKDHTQTRKNSTDRSSEEMSSQSSLSSDRIFKQPLLGRFSGESDSDLLSLDSYDETSITGRTRRPPISEQPVGLPDGLPRFSLPPKGIIDAWTKETEAKARDWKDTFVPKWKEVEYWLGDKDLGFSEGDSEMKYEGDEDYVSREDKERQAGGRDGEDKEGQGHGRVNDGKPRKGRGRPNEGGKTGEDESEGKIIKGEGESKHGRGHAEEDGTQGKGEEGRKEEGKRGRGHGKQKGDGKRRKRHGEKDEDDSFEKAEGGVEEDGKQGRGYGGRYEDDTRGKGRDGRGKDGKRRRGHAEIEDGDAGREDDTSEGHEAADNPGGRSKKGKGWRLKKGQTQGTGGDSNGLKAVVNGKRGADGDSGIGDLGKGEEGESGSDGQGSKERQIPVGEGDGEEFYDDTYKYWPDRRGRFRGTRWFDTDDESIDALDVQDLEFDGQDSEFVDTLTETSSSELEMTSNSKNFRGKSKAWKPRTGRQNKMEIAGGSKKGRLDKDRKQRSHGQQPEEDDLHSGNTNKKNRDTEPEDAIKRKGIHGYGDPKETRKGHRQQDAEGRGNTRKRKPIYDGKGGKGSSQTRNQPHGADSGTGVETTDVWGMVPGNDSILHPDGKRLRRDDGKKAAKGKVPRERGRKVVWTDESGAAEKDATLGKEDENKQAREGHDRTTGQTNKDILQAIDEKEEYLYSNIPRVFFDSDEDLR